MPDTAIRVERLSKRYRIGLKEGMHDTLGGAVADFVTRPIKNLRRLRRLSKFSENGRDQEDIIWAVRDISFEVKEGEVVGIIGRNGAGKSTLLKILSRITEPTSGRVVTHGRVSSLLEVGTGFHPELTGRENVYLNGAVLGMHRKEIQRKFDEIVDFSGVEKFIDTPVKRYSSGMQVRLAFSVAAHLEPEILLVDEVLAVGDVGFQKKCLGKMSEVAKGGRTILFVSHNLGAISELCGRAILLDEGQQLEDGGVAEVINSYLRLNETDENHVSPSVDPSLPCSIVEVNSYTEGGSETRSFDINEDFRISITYQVKEEVPGLVVAVIVSRHVTELFYSLNDEDSLEGLSVHKPGLYRAEYTIPKMFLKAGTYSVRVNLGMPGKLIQSLDPALHFDVEEHSVNTHAKGYRKDRPGCVISPGTWQTLRLE